MIGTLRGATWPLKHFLFETVRPLLNVFSSKASLDYLPDTSSVRSSIVHVRHPGRKPRRRRRSPPSFVLREMRPEKRIASRPASSTCTDTGDEELISS